MNNTIGYGFFFLPGLKAYLHTKKLGCLTLGLSRYSYRPTYQKKGWKWTGGPGPGGGLGLKEEREPPSF